MAGIPSKAMPERPRHLAKSDGGIFVGQSGFALFSSFSTHCIGFRCNEAGCALSRLHRRTVLQAPAIAELRAGYDHGSKFGKAGVAAGVRQTVDEWLIRKQDRAPKSIPEQLLRERTHDLFLLALQIVEQSLNSGKPL